MKGFKERITHFLGLDEPRFIKRFYIYAFIIILGCVIGAIAGGTFSAAGNEKIIKLAGDFINKYTSPKFSELFFSSLLAYGIYFIICILSGCFAFGMVISGAAVFIKGLGCGMISGILCCNVGINGFIFYVLAILPGFLSGGMVLSYLCALSCDSSVIYFNSFYGRGKKRNSGSSLIYNFIICVFIFLFTALTDAVLGKLFNSIL